MHPTEEEIQEALNLLLKMFHKMEEFISDPSYRIIRSMNDEIEEDKDEDNSRMQNL